MSIQTPITQARAAYNLASFGGASQDACNAAFADLHAAVRAAQTDEQAIALLRAEADDKHRRSDEKYAEATRNYDIARTRILQGETALAATFTAMGKAKEATAAELGLESFRAEEQIAQIQARNLQLNLSARGGQ